MKKKFFMSAGIAVSGVATMFVLTDPAFAASTTGSLHKPTWVAHPPIHVKNGATSSYQKGLVPAQIKDAYGLSQLQNDGAGITVAIIDAYGSPTIQTDLQRFDSQFGIQDPANGDFTVVNLGVRKTDPGWALETSLDVEWVHALAPAAKIMLVEAPSASLNDLLNAIDFASSHGAQVVSNSWGGSEFSGESTYDPHFANPGIVYTASSGDNGAGVSWPAASPNVLGVGGTTLTLSGNSYTSETAWSGSGGGQSTYEQLPLYQSVPLSLAGRGIPDVAWDADPNTGVAVYDSTQYQGQAGWFQVGGTSFGAPSWAALIADTDQQLTSNLYDSSELLKVLYIDGNGNYFHDITTGNNGTYFASQGYDLVTGIGSPKADTLIPALVQYGTTNNQSASIPTSTGGTGGTTGSGSGHGNGHGHSAK